MKKLVCVLLLLCLLFTPGCGKSPEDDETETDNLITVGFSQVGAESDWRAANTKSMQESLSEASGFELYFNDAKQKQDTQIKAIRTFIQQQVDYIVLAPVTESGWESVLEEAAAAGIPVIIVDRQVDVSNPDLYCSWVGSDFRKEADMAVEWLETELKRQGRDEEEINILHLQGTMGATAQIQRSRGLEVGVGKNMNWHIVSQLECEYTQAAAYEQTLKYLKKNRNIDVIYSENDNMTFGAMEAMDELGITYGLEGDVMIISFDAVHSALENCINKKINLCVECNPLHGPRVITIIRQLENGITPSKLAYVPETCFDARTITRAQIDSRTY